MKPVREQLNELGPSWWLDAAGRPTATRSTSRPRFSLAEAEDYCRRLTRWHYENFPVASLLLPRPLRQHFCNVYAYCRWADDLADEIGNRQHSLDLLDWWLDELHECYQGRAWHPVFVALRRTVEQFGIPVEPFEDLLSAFRQDQLVREYATFEQLLDYCRRSANPVGRLVLYVCGRAGPQNFAWSDSICTGLQLTNFWQDVRRDFQIGRVYLPREDRQRFGYSDQDLAAQRTNDAFRALLRFEVDRAERFLRDGLPLVDQMPGRLQVDVEMFAAGGLRILERIRAIDYGVWQRRPVLTRGDRMRLLAASTWRFVLRRLGLLRKGVGLQSKTSSVKPPLPSEAGPRTETSPLDKASSRP